MEQTRKEMEKYGVNNITCIISLMFVLKLTLESIGEYGFLMKIPLEDLTRNEMFAFAKIMLILVSMAFFSFFTKKYSRLFSMFFVLGMKSAVGIICVYELQHMYFSCFCCTLSIYITLKLISFCFYKEKGEDNIKHFIYFLLVPSIIYKRDFKMKSKRCFKKIRVLFYKLIVSALLLLFTMDQLSLPTMLKVKSSKNIYSFIANFLTLSLCTIILFWLFFYMFFCCILEILSDLTLYDENDFYGPWWNAKTVKWFWANWNKMVYQWIKMYIYLPLLTIKVPKKIAGFICFVISGILHEYIIFSGSKVFKGYTMMGFLLQTVLMETTDHISTLYPVAGNVFFWCIFCVVGQPACIWLTYR